MHANGMRLVSMGIILISAINMATAQSIMRSQPDPMVSTNNQPMGNKTDHNIKLTNPNSQGAPTYALDLDGTDDYLYVDPVAVAQVSPTAALTLECWVYHSDWTTCQNQSFLDTSSPGGYSLGTNNTNLFGTVYRNNAVAQVSTSLSSLSSGWHHIAMTFDGQYTCLYIDGNRVDSDDAGSSSSITYVTDGSIFFGAHVSDTGDADQFFSGILDEYRIWNVARAQEGIRRHAYENLLGSETTINAYWQFNEGPGRMFSSDVTDGIVAITQNTDIDQIWVNSTIPFGDGQSDQQIVTDGQTGTVTFMDTGFGLDIVSKTGVDTFTATRIDRAPNSLPAGESHVYDSQYWVVKSYGSGSFSASMTFTLSEGLSSQDELDPNRLSLYRRPSHSDGSWSWVGNAQSVNAAANQATFAGINDLSQFIVTGTSETPPVTVSLEVRLFLEGFYQSASDDMTTSIHDNSWLPETSPYSDSRTISSATADVVDWIYVEVRSSMDGPALAAKSFLLRSDGYISGNDGSEQTFELTVSSEGDYYLIVRHRNHCTVMSASALSLSSSDTATYAFDTASTQYYQSGDAIEVETGIWALVAGDINQDQQVTTADYTKYYNSSHNDDTGYVAADLNGDGSVDSSDLALWHSHAQDANASRVP